MRLASEKGQSMVLFAFMLMGIMAFMAMSIDVGRLVWARTQMQAAVDAAALAGAQSLPDSLQAEASANEYWLKNSTFLQAQGQNVAVTVTLPTTSKAVAIRGDADIPTIFARVLGIPKFHVSASAEAESVVLDTMLVLDRSGSMCFDNYGPNGSFVSRVRLRMAIKSTDTVFQVRRDNTLLPLSSYMYVGQVFRLDKEWLEVTGIVEPDTVQVIRGVPNPNNGSSSKAANHSAGTRPRGDTCQQAGASPYYPWEYIKAGGRVFVNQLDARFDRSGYVHFSTKGTLEMSMTNALGQVQNAIATSPDPSAFGINDRYTNIAHGFYLANQELVSGGRANAKWVVVLLSDGVANRYCSGGETQACAGQGSNSSTARARALAQADSAASHGIIVYTIGYGANSDDALMQAIADRTGGTFFKVPTEAQLATAFIEIARQTHVKLTQ